VRQFDPHRRTVRGPRDRRSEAGQALVLFALSLVGLLAMTGLVIDIGGAWAQVRTEQKVADVAALAGATAEANGASRAQIIEAALDSAAVNGFPANEVQVNIPPTSGKYGPGGSGYSPSDCSVPAQYPCWVEVVINRQHSNSFSRVVGLNSFSVSARGVAVGGIANTVTNGAAPLMFNFEAVINAEAEDAGEGDCEEDGEGEEDEEDGEGEEDEEDGDCSGDGPTTYCDPHPSKCGPNSSWPLDPNQFAWTTYCLSPVNCNVNSADAVALIEGGNFQFTIDLNMYLGPHNNGQKTAVCHALLDQFPDGADLPVAINDDNGKLVGYWVWHLDTANSDCEGAGGEQLSGWFVDDITETLPLTITAGGGTTTFGKNVVRLVE